jgi:hypothetical protein
MNETSALCLPLQDLDALGRPEDGVARPPELRIAAPTCAAAPAGGSSLPLVVLRDPDLLADLRHARAARFASRYEWLSLRRRRAQIAARHELEG